MHIQTLISTMNLSDHKSLIQAMGVGENSITINQITDIGVRAGLVENDIKHTLLSYHERGLSRSRNKALDAAQADICIVADDDMRYEADYEDTITKAYSELPKADIIAFRVDSEDPRQSKKILKNGRLNRITSMKIASWQITFRRDSVIGAKVRFDETFGAGAQNYMGEENIFLYDCIRRGLKVHYMPVKIATLQDEANSTWFEGYTERYFVVKGSAYRRMSRWLWVIFMIQFSLRKYPVYRDSMSLNRAMFYITKGAMQ